MDTIHKIITKAMNKGYLFHGKYPLFTGEAITMNEYVIEEDGSFIGIETEEILMDKCMWETLYKENWEEKAKEILIQAIKNSKHNCEDIV